MQRERAEQCGAGSQPGCACTHRHDLDILVPSFLGAHARHGCCCCCCASTRPQARSLATGVCRPPGGLPWAAERGLGLCSKGRGAAGCGSWSARGLQAAGGGLSLGESCVTAGAAEQRQRGRRRWVWRGRPRTGGPAARPQAAAPAHGPGKACRGALAAAEPQPTTTPKAVGAQTRPAPAPCILPGMQSLGVAPPGPGCDFAAVNKLSPLRCG